MARINRLLAKLRNIFERSRAEDDLAREVAAHLAMLEDDFLRRGMTPHDARLAARREYGGVEQSKELHRDERSFIWLEHVFQDLRHALRSLWKSPGFSTVALLSLALGIGANTAMFTLTDQALLRTLPVKDPRQLVLLTPKGGFIGGSMRGMDSFSFAKYLDLRDGNPGVFSGIAARYQDNVDVATGGTPDRAVAELVSGNYFQVLGVEPGIGRTILPEDDQVSDAGPYVVLSDSYWKRRFGGDPSVLNRTINVNGHPMTVVGVAQRGFAGFALMTPSDLFVPLSMKMTVTPTWDHRARRDSVWLKIFARLAPGVSPEKAKAAIAIPYRRALENDLHVVHRSAQFSQRYLRGTVDLISAGKGYDHLQQSFAKPLYLLFAMVGVLLLITCVNVANLLISRAASRQKEIAVRLSLGATRGMLIRMILIESMTLSFIGGALGLTLSYWVAGLLVRVMPYDNIEFAFRIAPDLRILGFTAAVSIVAALLFGFTPALHATRPVAENLKGQGTGLRKLLVSAQVGLSMLLLVGAGLFARSLYKLMSSDPGMETTHLLTFHTDPSLHGYNSIRAHQLILDLQSRLQTIPGVASAGGAMVGLLSGQNWTNTVHVEGYKPHENEDTTFGWNSVTPGYFTTLGVPLIAGRDFTAADAGDKITKAIVDESFARRFGQGGNIVGMHMGFGGSGPTDIEIVGVVRDIKNTDMADKPRPFHYTPMLQDNNPEIQMYLRTRGNPMAVVPAVRRELARLDTSLPMLDIQTVDMQIGRTHYLERLFAWLSGAFGVLATLLAAIGLYGVTAFAVARRTREIGIRMALGASVLGMVMREVLLLAASGVVIGIPLALVLGRYAESQLHQMKASDPLIEISATTAIIVVALVAGYLPARRAARTDPITALRYE